MRDVLTIPFNQSESIIIASGNSGAIGQKKGDAVKVPYETVSYYAFRVAVMECISAGAEPFAVTLQNFCGNEAWEALKDGVQKGLGELSLHDVKITGSTESNFPMSESAIGLTVLGKKGNSPDENELIYSPEQTNIAVIGTPLVGNEVMEREAEAAPLSLFQRVSSMERISTLPVGSKGILFELNQLFSNRTFSEAQIETSLDILKSSGPSTCFIVAYPRETKKEIEAMAGEYFHKLVEAL